MSPVHGKTMAPTEEKLDYLFHHLFLPAKLPGGDDDSVANATELIDVVLRSLRRFLSETGPDDTVAITKCIEMVDGMKKLGDSRGYLDEAGVREALRQLSIEGTYRRVHDFPSRSNCSQ
jgi:hypothetical protein